MKNVAELPDLPGVSRQFTKVRTDSDLKFAQEKQFLDMHLRRSKDLRNCTANSVVQAVLTAGSMGLSLNPMAEHVYLIPRRMSKDSDVWICTATPSYKGLIALAIKSGAIAQIAAEIVFRGDDFRYLGPMKMPEHSAVLDPTRRDVKDAIGVYTIARFTDGGIQCSYTDREQVLRAQAQSDNPNGLMWHRYWPEGWKKTAIRRAWKTLPLNDTAVQMAISAMDNAEGYIEGEAEAVPEKRLSKEQTEELEKLVEHFDEKSQKRWLSRTATRFGVTSVSDIPEDDFENARSLLTLGIESALRRVEEVPDGDTAE